MRSARSPRARRRLGAAALLAVGLLSWQVAVAAASHRVVAHSHARAVATAINLIHADLPTLKQVGSISTTPEGENGARLSACAGGVPDRLAFANVSSPSFVSNSEPSTTISSSTEIFPSAGLVAQDLAAAQSARGQKCIQQALQASLRSQAQKNETFSAKLSLRPAPVSGTDTAVEVRVAILATVASKGKTVSVPLTADFIGFGWGQAEVTLSVMTTLTPPSARLERQLGAILVRRARAAIG
ncbi:MAG TPA: hypothetical protein VHX66_12360 [Solirubrobacteraceae bacterium]|nr:hypothetical protein [Solirubrobacteraceae bacterium]